MTSSQIFNLSLQSCNVFLQLFLLLHKTLYIHTYIHSEHSTGTYVETVQHLMNGWMVGSINEWIKGSTNPSKIDGWMDLYIQSMFDGSAINISASWYHLLYRTVTISPDILTYPVTILQLPPKNKIAIPTVSDEDTVYALTRRQQCPA